MYVFIISADTVGIQVKTRHNRWALIRAQIPESRAVKSANQPNRKNKTKNSSKN